MDNANAKVNKYCCHSNWPRGFYSAITIQLEDFLLSSVLTVYHRFLEANDKCFQSLKALDIILVIAGLRHLNNFLTSGLTTMFLLTVYLDGSVLQMKCQSP